MFPMMHLELGLPVTRLASALALLSPPKTSPDPKELWTTSHGHSHSLAPVFYGPSVFVYKNQFQRNCSQFRTVSDRCLYSIKYARFSPFPAV